MKSRLPVPCKLKTGESLPGFLSRAATTNHYESLQVLAPWFGLRDCPKGIRVSDLRALACGEVSLMQLAAFTENDLARVKEAALRLPNPRTGSTSDHFLALHRWRYCPLCVRNGAVHQRYWMLAFATACPVHECRLVDHCHRCGKKYRITVALSSYCANCQEPAEAVPAHHVEIECSRRLADSINKPEQRDCLLHRIMTTWFLSDSEALRPHHRFSPQLQSVESIRQRLIHIWHAASRSEHLAQALYRQRKNLSIRWPYLPYAGSLLSNRAMEVGTELPPQRPPGAETDKRSLISDDDPWMVPHHVAAQAADISEFVIKELIEARLVKSRTFIGKNDSQKKYKLWLIKLDSLHALIAELFSDAQTPPKRAKTSNILQHRLHEVIRDVRAGRMLIYSQDAKSLRELRVLFHETRTFERRMFLPSDAMIVHAVSQKLDIYHDLVADLVKRDILSTHPSSSSRRLLITKESIERFDNKYIFVGAVARLFRVNSTNLAEKLQTLGVKAAPITGPVTIYYRSDIESIDATQVHDIKHYETHTGRKSQADAASAPNKRVAKLIGLVEEHGGVTAFTRRYGGSAGTLSQMMRGQKSFGDLAAKRMEQKAQLPIGWLSEESD